ncbi:MAG: cation-transporting P-type ATPase [Bacilli bacterium]|nr:cation-transporting P-type ATPase [Bacilli bacterium]
MKEKYYSKSKEDVIKYLKSSINGLTETEAKNRLKMYGPNELPKQKKDSILKIFLTEFKDPMKIILIITVIMSLIIGEILDAFTLIIIILVDVIIGTIEEWKAKKTAESLINMIKVKTKVIRDGKEEEIDSKKLVIGDIIDLDSGTKISADARIIECHNFEVDESPLTGESIAVTKNDNTLTDNVILAERKNMVYAGTTVITGRAKAIVVGVAANTEIGQIAEKVTQTKEEKSPLTIRIEKFSKQISIMISFIALIIALVLYTRHYNASDILLSVIALSVSAMPEGLALAMTMALTIASKRMAKKNVIVKKLNSVESLGSCTVIATDKTGTLTLNEQTAKIIMLPDGSRYEITGTGYNDNGKVIPVEGSDIEKAKEIAYLGYINNEAHLEKENKWNYFGDSIDIAFLSLAKKLKINQKPRIIETIPYESENRYSAVFYEKGDKKYCTVKGSLEKIMEFSEEKELYKKQIIELTEKGYRVIALADGEVKDIKKENIKNLQFKGLIAFIDPVRTTAKKSIKDCLKAGIKVIMITGDHPLTAGAIAKDLGLVTKDTEVATGKDVEKYFKLGEKKFDEFVRCIKVFSRVTPLDKLNIVNSLKRQGEFVAVTGDGVNDAPAIKSANIGISMGSGTDVAKEAASMIIKDDSFSAIVEGVKEGRIAYSNIRKITLFLVSCGLSEVAVFILSIFFGYNIPFLAIHLLWLNIVTDGLQDIALSFEKADDTIMNEKPRNTKESLFSKDLIIEVLILGISIALIVFNAWKYMVDNNVDIKVARTIIVMLMVFIQNINVLNCRSEKTSVFKKSLLSNQILIITIISSILLQIIASKITPLAYFLKITPLSYNTIIKLLPISLIIILVFEVYKIIYHMVKNNNYQKG